MDDWIGLYCIGLDWITSSTTLLCRRTQWAVLILLASSRRSCEKVWEYLVVLWPSDYREFQRTSVALLRRRWPIFRDWWICNCRWCCRCRRKIPRQHRNCLFPCRVPRRRCLVRSESLRTIRLPASWAVWWTERCTLERDQRCRIFWTDWEAGPACWTRMRIRWESVCLWAQ